MSFSVGKLPFLGITTPQVTAINSPQNITPRFNNNLEADSFESKNPARYTSEFMINKLATNNPKLQRILKDSGLEYNLYMDNLNEILAGHCTDTRNIAEGIVENLPFALESKANLDNIRDAAYLHDIGKVFIPPEILNKSGQLNDAEKELVHKHSELGYELLKDSGLDKKVTELIRNHHQDAKRSGYPIVGQNFNADIDLQILSAADKYSALTEERSYKKPMSREQALTIIRADARNGKINPLIYNALVNYTDKVALSQTEDAVK